MRANCFITDIKIELPNIFNENNETILTYGIQVEGIKCWFKFDINHQNSSYVESNKHLFYGIIANNFFPSDLSKGQILLTNEILEKIIRQSPIPKSPEEKLNRLLLEIHSKLAYEGEIITFPEEENLEIYSRRIFFRNYSELRFYLNVLEEMTLIKGVFAHKGNERLVMANMTITYNGLAQIIELQNTGTQSVKCFIAMSFSKELEALRKTIKDALDSLGHQPILIDEIHFSSDVTINDAIIAELRSCKFVIADFTQQKHGVYFEAGFALGLGRPVIYTCSQGDFENTHFDTNHYPHIVYSELSELKEKLSNKIRAWID